METSWINKFFVVIKMIEAMRPLACIKDVQKLTCCLAAEVQTFCLDKRSRRCVLGAQAVPHVATGHGSFGAQ
jgi:hypothetical protein